MWSPTHVQVTVHKAINLLTKGKNNTNDCFVTIALGKIKYQTSVKEKAGQNVEWHEECELPIPDQGNTAEIVLTALHRSLLGVEEFLGRVTIPLNSIEVYDRPKNKWYPLQSKPGKSSKTKERGHLEVKIGFTVKSGSLTDLSKKEKHKSSIGQLSSMAQSVGGSLLSLGTIEKRKGIKKFAKSIGSKMHLKGKKKDNESDGGSSIGSVGSLKIRNSLDVDRFKSKQTREDADPGVVSDEDDFTFDDLSHKSSASSLSQNNNLTNSAVETTPENSRRAAVAPSKPPRIDKQDEWESKLFANKPKGLLKPGSSESLNRRSWEATKLASLIKEEEPSELLEAPKVNEDNISIKSTPEFTKKEEKNEGMLAKLKNFRKDKLENEAKQLGNSRIVGLEMEATTHHNRISNELLQKFEGKTREDLILALCDTQSDLEKEKKKRKDLEDYLDDLLLRVMETQPKILQNPYISCKLAHKKITG